MVQSNHKYVVKISQINTEPFTHFVNGNFNTFTGGGLFNITSGIADNSIFRKINFSTASNSLNWTPGVTGSLNFTITMTGYVLNSGSSPFMTIDVDGNPSLSYSMSAYPTVYPVSISVVPTSIITMYIQNGVPDDFFPIGPNACDISLTTLSIT